MRCLITPGDGWNENGAPGHHGCKLGVIFYAIIAAGYVLWGPINLGIEGVQIGSEKLHNVDWPSFSKDLDGYLLQYTPDLMSADETEQPQVEADKRQGLAQAAKLYDAVEIDVSYYSKILQGYLLQRVPDLMSATADETTEQLQVNE